MDTLWMDCVASPASVGVQVIAGQHEKLYALVLFVELVTIDLNPLHRFVINAEKSALVVRCDRIDFFLDAAGWF